MASDFRLEVVDVSGIESAEDDTSPAALLDLYDASGRRFPAHLAAYRLAYPPMYWFVRNGGWNTAKAFPNGPMNDGTSLRTPTPRSPRDNSSPPGQLEVHREDEDPR